MRLLRGLIYIALNAHTPLAAYNSPPRTVKEHKEPVIPSIAVDSFLPLLKTFPALVLDGNTYHLRGPISTIDLQNLSAYAQTIGVFTLNSEPTGDKQHRVAPGALMRLAQLKMPDTPGPLLPSLRQLRVVKLNELTVSQLSLFFTKSLRFLEATGVPEDQQSAFFSFLVTLVDEAPLLSTIKFGPGSFTADCLNSCLSFGHLSHLELLDVASSIDLDLLVAIGGLPELETFILSAQAATYASPSCTKRGVPSSADLDSPQPRSPVFGRQFAFSEYSNEAPRPRSPYPMDTTPPQCPQQWPWPESQTPPPNPTTPKLPDSPQPLESIDFKSRSVSTDLGATVGRFSRLKRLEVIGILPLINDLYEHVVSADLESLGLTLVRKIAPTYHPVKTDSVPVTTNKRGKNTPARTPVVLKSSTVGDIDMETSSFCTLIETAVEEKWTLTLKGVRLGHLQNYRGRRYYESVDPDPVPLPSTTFTMLLRHKKLEDLEIEGWTLPSEPSRKPPFSTILDAALPNLKTIRLPVCRPTPGIELDQLLSIIRAFPKLVSLKCGFKEPQTFPIPQIPAADIPLHGLKVLSVGHEDLDIDQKQKLRIARFLDILFPDLERIETHAGYHEGEWTYIHELIKMCQASRLDHATRLLGTAPQM